MKATITNKLRKVVNTEKYVVKNKAANLCKIFKKEIRFMLKVNKDKKVEG